MAPEDPASELSTAVRNQGFAEWSRASRASARATVGPENSPRLRANWKRTRGEGSSTMRASRPASSGNASDSRTAWTRTSGWASSSAGCNWVAASAASPSRAFSACRRAWGEAWPAAMAAKRGTTDRSCRSTSRRWAVRRHQMLGWARWAASPSEVWLAICTGVAARGGAVRGTIR